MEIDKKKLLKIKRNAPVFIIGCQRSGTSFLFRALEKTLDIGFGRDNTLFIGFEKNIKNYGSLENDKNLMKMLNDIESTQIFKTRFKNLNIATKEFVSCLESREYNDIVRTIFAYWALIHDKSKWGGKTPDYTAHIDKLYRLFPDVKIIHVLRDGRDVCLSLSHLPWGPKDVYIAAKYWKKRIMKANSFNCITKNNYFEVKYEDLLIYPEKTFNELYFYLNFSSPDNTEFNNNLKKYILPKILQNNTDKWKKMMSKNNNKIFESEAGDILEKNGYKICNKNYNEYKLNGLKILYHHINNIVLKIIKGEGLKIFKNIGLRYKYDK